MMMASNTNNIFTSSSIIVVIVVGVALLICTIVTEDGSTVHSFILQNTRGVLTKEKSIFIRECDRVVRYQNHGQHLYGGRRRHHQQQHRQDPHKHRNRWRKRMIPSSSYNSVLRESSIEYYDSLNDDIHETRSPKEEGTDDDLTVTMTMKTMMTSMTNFFSSMVDPSTNRFYYLYRYKHQSQQYIHRHQQQKNDEDHQQEDLDQFVHHHVPIRDLAASWDATKAIQFFYAKNDDEDDDDDVNIDATTETASITMQYRTERRLLDAIRTTLSSYHLLQNSSSSSSSSSTDRSFIDTSDLADGETPNIGHSSMWVLGAIGWKRICDCQQRRKVQQETVLTRTDIKNRKFQSDVLSPFSTSIIDMNILRSNISSLIEGILEQQNDNGSFRTNFNLEDHRPNDKDGSMDDIQEGIEFFPGEAMLALMEVYHESSSPSLDREDRNKSLVDEKTCQSIRTAMTRAFDFYSSYYDQHKQRLGTNYNIWQIQAFSRFFLALNGNDLQNGDTINEMDGQHFMDRLYNYITTLCDDIVSSPAWKELNRGQSFYRNLQTLEIVCGLDALLDGLSVVEETTVKSSSTCNTGSSSTDDGNNNNVETEHKEDDEKIRLYRLHVMNAIDFLKWAQDQTINSNGGLGYGGLQVTEQRLDVTGHAISALSKAAKLTI